MNFSNESIIQCTKNNVCCDLGGEMVILNLKDSAYYGLDPIGKRVWSLIQEPTSFEKLLNQLLDEYEVDVEKCREDLESWVVELAETGLVEVRND
jgi:Coenzyme PQQ synthesis protein D (PqqD)